MIDIDTIKHIKKLDNILIVFVDGELEFFDYKKFKAIFDGLSEDITDIMVDIRNTTRMASTSVGIFIGLSKQRNISFIVQEDNPLMTLFDILNIKPLFSFYSDLEQAILDIKNKKY